MDVLVGFLVLLVGLAVGVLVALLLDGFYLGRQLQTAVSQRDDLQSRLQQTQDDLRNAHQELERAAHQLELARQKTDRLWEENRALGQQLETAESAAVTLQKKLARAVRLGSSLHTQKQIETQKRAIIHKKQKSLRAELADLRAELADVQSQYQTACQHLTHTERDLQRVQTELAAAQARAQHTNKLEQETAVLQAKLKTADHRADDFQAQVNSLLRQLSETRTLHGRITDFSERLQQAYATVDNLKQQLQQQQQFNRAVMADKTRLELIDGIGPTYARRLREAGVETLADLARQTPERVTEITKIKSWHGRDPQEWIDEAAQLVANASGTES